MMMVTGKFTIDPEQRDAFLVFIREMIASERQSAGCLSFDIYEDVTTPNLFLLLEQWEDEAALDAHTETVEYLEFDAQLNDFVTGEPSFEEFVF